MKKYVYLLLSFIFLLTVSTVIEQFLTGQIQAALQTSSTESQTSTLTIWVLALSTAFIDLFMNLFMVLLFAFYLLKKGVHAETGLDRSAYSAAQYLSENVQQLVIEQIRVMGSVLLWSLFLLLPGLFRFMQLIFVPFVVLLDNNYRIGERDALQTSKALFMKAPLKTAATMIFLFVLWPLLSTLFFDEYLVFSQYPFQAFLIVCLESVMTLFGLFILYKIFVKSRGALNGINV